MTNLKNQVEAVLFAVGKRISAEEIAKVCRAPAGQVKKALEQLEQEYNSKDSALMITGSDDYWKINVREKYLPLCKDLISETDLDMQTMETLALIAYSHPCLQSDIIKNRTAKAYDHIKELVEMGFITKEPKGRTRLLKLTQKFFDYFDLSREKADEIFKQFHDDEQRIQEGEEELNTMRAEREKEREEIKKIQKERENKVRDVGTRLEKIDKEVGRLEVRNPEEIDKEVSRQIDELESELEKERMKKRSKARHLLKAMGKDISDLEKPDQEAKSAEAQQKAGTEGSEKKSNKRQKKGKGKAKAGSGKNKGKIQEG